MQQIDYAVSDSGSLFLFHAVSLSAQDHASEAFANAMEFGGAYVVEPRYAGDIIYDLVNECGFTVELDGQVIAEFTRA